MVGPGVTPLMQNKNEFVIIDEVEPCPYLPGETARMPLRMPLQPLTDRAMDQLLAQGHRRTGEFIYQTNCPRCRACEPIRIECAAFEFNATWRRVLNKGDRILDLRVGPLQCDRELVHLFNKHRRLRGLAKNDSDIDIEEYHWGFVKTCFNSFEIAYYEKGRLVGLAVCDSGQEAMSAVYTFYDPDFKGTSLGTYSILKQIDMCNQMGWRYLYLGFYVENSVHMRYKARFRPQQRLHNGIWKTYH